MSRFLDETGLAQVAGHVNKKASIFYGTQAEWDELTIEEKKKYDYAAFGDGGSESSKKDFYIFISDSYNDGAYDPNPDHIGWIPRCAERLQLAANQWVNCAQSGGSFQLGTWIAKLTEYYQSITDLEAQKVTHIVIGGGINDCLTDGVNNYSQEPTVNDYLTKLYNCIGEVSTYCTAHFPNAQIYFCPVGYALESSPVLWGRSVRSRAYCYAYMRQAMADFPNYVLPTNTEFCLHNKDLLYSGDWLHPNNSGTIVIARTIAQAIKTGTSVSESNGWHTVTLTGNSSIDCSHLTFSERLDNDKVLLNISGFMTPTEQVTIGTGYNLGIGDFKYLNNILGSANVQLECQTPNGNIAIPGQLSLGSESDGVHVYINGRILNPSAWTYDDLVLNANEANNIHSSVIVIPTNLC